VKIEIPHINEERDWSASSPRVCLADGGRYLKLSFARSPGMEWNQEHFHNFDRESVRGKCKGFSFGSRRRMLDRLNQISVAAEHPDFVTLTLPDDCFDDCVSSFAKTAKGWLDVLLKRVSRVCPSATGFWRIEWKARKSGLHEGKLFPHFHLLVWGLPQRSWDAQDRQGRDVVRSESFVVAKDSQLSFVRLCDEVARVAEFDSERKAMAFLDRKARVEANFWFAEDRPERPVSVERGWLSFFDWISLAWYHVVGTGNVDHFTAGCRVEKIRTWGGVLSYCAKYMSKADSDNFMSEETVGRSWGIFNRADMPWAKLIELPLSEEQGIRLRRVARRYLEHRLGRRVQRHYGMTLYCDVSNWKRLCQASDGSWDDPF
jgi:hypothetical protein